MCYHPQMAVRTVKLIAWRSWELLPERVRGVFRPALAALRRRTRSHTPLPSGWAGPEPPSDAVELDTQIGTFWFDRRDVLLTPFIRSQGVWEADLMKLMTRTVRAGDVVVDVGANVGFHAVLASRLVGAAGRVYAVEPMPWTLEMLRANLARHECTNVEVIPVAATDTGGSMRLSFREDELSSAGLRDGEAGVEVETAPLDELLPGVAASFLKIDVEGAEPAVLRGARALLERSPRALLVVEFRNEPHFRGESPEEVLAYYESLGFELSVLRRNGDLKLVSRDEMLVHARGFPSLNIVLSRSKD
jgi:FkbM family methyltransferase